MEREGDLVMSDSMREKMMAKGQKMLLKLV
jgi:hypothetical protein